MEIHGRRAVVPYCDGWSVVTLNRPTVWDLGRSAVSCSSGVVGMAPLFGGEGRSSARFAWSSCSGEKGSPPLLLLAPGTLKVGIWPTGSKDDSGPDARFGLNGFDELGDIVF